MYKFQIKPESGFVTGEIIIKREEGSRPLEWRMKVTLEVNSTRLFAHCQCSLESLRELQPRDFLADTTEEASEIREETLNNSDNYFLDNRVGLVVPINWSDVVNLSVTKCLEYLEYAMVPPGQGYAVAGLAPSGVPSRPAPIQFCFEWHRWTLAQLETYWEFKTDDAISDIHAVAGVAREIANNASTTEYPSRDPSVSRQGNSVVLSIPLGRRNVMLTVYAKAMRRVRCEVRHLENPRTTYRQLQTVRSLTADRLENLFGLIDAVNDQARQRAFLLMNAIWHQNVRPRATMVQIAMFLSYVAAACGHSYSLTSQVLSVLVMNGRAAKHGSPEFCRAIEYLLARGVLARTPATRRSLRDGYAIARPYASVIGELRRQVVTQD